MPEQDETYLKKAFEATKRTFKKAWEYDKKFETLVQYRIEKATSVVAPFLVLLATAEVNYQYWRRSDEHILLIVIVSLMGLAFSTGILLFACSSLEAHLADRSSQNEKGESDGPLRGSPMLGFAAFLFSLGAAFTAVEAIEHFYVPAIGYPDDNGNRADFRSPWGDILLAASAICMCGNFILCHVRLRKKEAYAFELLIDDEKIQESGGESQRVDYKVENGLAQASAWRRYREVLREGQDSRMGSRSSAL